MTDDSCFIERGWTKDDHCHIIVGIDEKFLWPCAVTLCSFFMKNHVKTTVHVFHTGLSSRGMDSLRDVVSKFCKLFSMCFYFVAAEEMESLQVSGANWSKEVFLRLFSVEVLPSDIERAFFFDADLLITGNLSKAYKADFKNAVVRAARDVVVDSRAEHKKDINILPRSMYFNAGFLVLHLQPLRELLSENNWRKMLIHRGKGFKYNDQDILNIVCENRVDILRHREFNLILDGRRVPAEDCASCVRAAKVLHYGGGPRFKPWNTAYDRSYGDLWWSVAERFGVPAWEISGFSRSWDPRRIASVNRAWRMLRRIVQKFWSIAHHRDKHVGS